MHICIFVYLKNVYRGTNVPVFTVVIINNNDYNNSKNL